MTARNRDLSITSLTLPSINDKMQYIATFTGNIDESGMLNVGYVTGQVVTGPSTSTSGDIPTFSDGSGKRLVDSGKKLPSGDVVGTTDSQTLTNKTITGGTHTAITSFGLRSSGSGAFDVTIRNTENLTAARTLTLKVNDGDHTLTIASNATISGPTPSDTPGVSHQFITAYTASTGAFTQAQPTASDMSNGVTGFGTVVLAITPTLQAPSILGVGGTLRFIAFTSSSGDPTTTLYTTDKDAGIHKNTTSGNVYLAYNDGGTIKKVQLT